MLQQSRSTKVDLKKQAGISMFAFLLMISKISCYETANLNDFVHVILPTHINQYEMQSDLWTELQRIIVYKIEVFSLLIAFFFYCSRK